MVVRTYLQRMTAAWLAQQFHYHQILIISKDELIFPYIYSNNRGFITSPITNFQKNNSVDNRM